MNERLRQDIQNTVGYNESIDKTEFMKGAEVANHIITTTTIAELNKKLVDFKEANTFPLAEGKSAIKDLQTIVRILNRYET